MENLWKPQSVKPKPQVDNSHRNMVNIPFYKYAACVESKIRQACQKKKLDRGFFWVRVRIRVQFLNKIICSTLMNLMVIECKMRCISLNLLNWDENSFC